MSTPRIRARSTRVRLTRARSTRARLIATVGAVGIVAALLHASQAQAAAGSLVVTAAGSFQSELGCSSDWAPDCLTSQLADPDGDGTYTWRTTAIPAGRWAVKATVGASWAENYGVGGGAGGADIGFTVPAAGSATNFAYNSASHLLSISTGGGNLAVVAVGDFQSEAGCGGDWVTDCAGTRLSDSDGDGTYTWTTSALPVGTWQTKVTVGGSWAENYGAGGTAGGANIPFTVTAGSAETFSYNSTSHQLTVTAGAGPTTRP